MSRTKGLFKELKGFVEVLPDGSILVVFRKGIQQFTRIPIPEILSLKPGERIIKLGMIVVCLSRYTLPGAAEGWVVVFKSNTVLLEGSSITVSRRNLRRAAKRAGTI